MKYNAIRGYVMSIVDLGMKLNEKGVDVFVRYSGHTNSLDVDLYEGRWTSDNTYDKQWFVVLTPKGITGELGYNNILQNLKDIETTLKDLYKKVK
ncbi:MAG: hypothetical protein ACRDBY_14065 [Cetobacterium sp.]